MDKHNASVVLLYPELGSFVQVFGVGQKVSLSNYFIFATEHAKRFSVGWVKRCHPGTELTCADKWQTVDSVIKLFLLRQQSRFPGFASFQKILLKGLISLCCFIYCLEVAMCVHFVVEQSLQR